MIRKYKGKDLAKVLIYYGMIQNVESSKMKIVCPFHGDVNPSMVVDFETGNFLCYGCYRSGNAHTFVQYANPKLNDLQCAILLEKIVNSDEIKKLKIVCKKRKRIQNKQAMLEAEDYFYGLRQTDWNSIQSKEELEVFEYIKKRGFTARALNVVDCRANIANKAYPFIFPILDNGEFKGWVGRTTNKYVERKRKYLYNEGFRKRDTICGNYRQDKVVYICEGFFDYLSIRTKGHIKDVGAILGWHISDEQVEKLKNKGVTTVVSALDNDSCGIKGTNYLTKFFNVVRFQFPKGVKDAGEMTEEQFVVAKKRTNRMIRKKVYYEAGSSIKN